MNKKFDWMDCVKIILIIVVFMILIYLGMTRPFTSDVQVRRIVLDEATCYVAFVDAKRVDMDCLCATYEKSNLNEGGQR